jgi:eukaryotic-like serine/threonine-protein kinase
MTPGISIGRYRLYDEIASGGMATVHYARQLGAGGFARTVAIKRLHQQFAKDPDFVAMFLDEARLAARIRHPNVVTTLDVVATKGELFLVMEYVPGETLSRLCRRTGGREPVPPRIAAAILCGVLEGLHAAHEARDDKGEPLGIVHRDMSPQNILVGSDGISRVLDFGVAKAANRLHQTEGGKLKGKVAYMPPEQLGGEVSRSSDIYAAAVCLFEALTGRRPFGGETQVETMTNILNNVAPAPSTLVREIPSALDEVVAKGMAKSAADRYATAREMARAIEQAIPIASIRDVAEWTEARAGEALKRRAEDVRAIEASSSSSGVTPAEVISELSTKPPPPMPVEPPRRRNVVPILIVAFLGAVALAFVLVRRTPAEPPAKEPVVTASAPTPSPSPVVETPPVVTAVASPTPSIVKPLPLVKPKPTAKPKAVDCDPPYVEENGKKRYKKECL